MLSAPAIIFGAAGAVFMIGGFASASLELASLAQTRGSLARSFLERTPTQTWLPSGKGDRMAGPWSGRPLANHERRRVSVVEIVGLAQASVILRSESGEVLYRSDPRSGTTLLVKNTDLPVITLKEEEPAPAMQPNPVRAQEPPPVPRDQKPRRSPEGCLRDISPLAKAAGERNPSLCLAGDPVPPRA